MDRGSITQKDGNFQFTRELCNREQTNFHPSAPVTSIRGVVVSCMLAWRGWLTAAFSIVSIVIIFYPAESI